MREFSRKEFFKRDPHFCIQLSQNADTEIHTHDFIEIVYITKGSAMQTIGGAGYPVHRGTLLFINCGQTHSFTAQKSFTYYNLMLTPEFISDQLVDSGNLYEILSLSMFEEFQSAKDASHPLAQLSGEIIPEMDALFAALLREYQNNRPGRLILMRSYSSIILTHIFRRLCSPEESIVTPELLHYIEEHCSERLTLSALARKCFYHPSYLSRMFHELQGQTLTEYITEVRIKKAMKLLSETALPIEDICISCGFRDKTFFFKKFKELTGNSPANYRKLTLM